MRRLKTRNPWQAGLIAATALSVVGVYASLLSQAGQQEWAFLVLFVSLWSLLTLFWANDGYNEESGMMLAETIDHNVEHLHNRLVSLEKELKQLRTFGAAEQVRAVRPPRFVVPEDQLV